SICTLEFEDHRPLYDWFLDALRVACHPQQIEFARLNLTYTVMSKRKLLELVENGYVSGWDDPRMPTLAGLRRRGYTPEAIRSFCERIGVAKRNSTVDMALLEHHLREDLNKRAPRVMAVLRPLRVVIDYDPETRSGSSAEGRKVKATLHWVSAAHALPAEVRLYDSLFTTPNPGEAEDFTAVLNPNSLETLSSCRVEPSLAGAAPGSRYQF